MSKCAFNFSFQIWENTVYLSHSKRKGGSQMNEMEKLSALEAENQKLKRDNDQLLEIVAQMRVTLNRLILHYISDKPEDRV